MEIAKKLLSELRKEKIHLNLNGKDIEIISYGKNLSNDLVSKIKSNKEMLVKFLEAHKNETVFIPVLDSVGRYPLSSAQRRLWIVDQFEGQTAAFNMPFLISLDQKIDITLFEKAVYAVVDRHEVLRTIFKEDNKGEVWQEIKSKEELGLSIDYQDFRNETEIDKKVNQYIDADSNLPFNLETGPLLRVALFQISDSKFKFYYNMHHIISDGWSSQIMSRDVMAYYESYQTNTPPNVPALRIQYKDYASWQLERLSSEESSLDRAFWMETLSGGIPLIDLPTNRPRPVIKSYNGFSFKTHISSATTTKLKELCKENSASLFMGIAAGLKVLLHKYTSETDIIIGSPVPGRDQFELVDQIGFYLNILPLRDKISPKESFQTFLNTVKENTLAAYNHQTYPFDRLVEDLKLNYNMGRSPLFDVSVTFNNIVEGVGSVDKETGDEIQVLGESKCKNDIEFHFQEIDGQISFAINYNRDVYDQETMKLFMQHYKHILSNLVNNPKASIASIVYLTQQETDTILNQFNNTKKAFGSAKSVIDLFNEQLARTPKTTALVFHDKKMTFKELDEASNKVAHFLIENFGVKSNDVIGIKLDRNEWVLVAIIGVLKAGAGYVPVDPSLPNARKKHLIEDTALKVLITEANYIFDLDYFDGNIFAIDVEFESLENSEKLAIRPKGEDLAYVIYTSGSTGTPKGVLVPHNSLLASINSRNDYYEDLSSILAITPFSFDASIGILWNALTVGATYHIIDNEGLKNPGFIADYIIENKVDCLCNPPSIYSLILKENTFKNASLKRVIMGGESFNTNLVNEHFGQQESCKLFNEYGPSENTIWASVKQVEQQTTRNSIGKPVANNQFYILDTAMQLIPIGVKGEIYIGGDHLAKGYLNSSQLTDERFVINTFKEGERLYRTGDFGRWLANGEIEFLGRIDNQVKVRGFRVELGEIENQLRQKNDIDDVAVLAVEKSLNDHEVIAFITSAGQQNLTNLNSFLTERLPEYMIPNRYIQVDSLPLTNNGKVDKSKLIKKEGTVLASSVDYVPPTTEKEKLLVQLIEETLDMERIGMNDDFFAVGGNSLKLIELISKLKQHDISINIAEIIRTPVVKDMALLLEQLELKVNESI